MNWLHFLILCLACWRLSVLFSEDDAPYGLARKLRSWLSRKAASNASVRKTELHKGVRCIRCQSYWWALPMAAYAYHHSSLPLWLRTAGDIFLLWNALSAAAILIHRVPEKKS